MNKPTNPPRFIPLDKDSQGDSDDVLYYDRNASLDALFETITSRLLAAYNLLEMVYEFKNPPANGLSVLAIAATYLLSDANSLLQEFDPIALRLREERL